MSKSRNVFIKISRNKRMHFELGSHWVGNFVLMEVLRTFWNKPNVTFQKLLVHTNGQKLVSFYEGITLQHLSLWGPVNKWDEQISLPRLQLTLCSLHLYKILAPSREVTFLHVVHWEHLLALAKPWAMLRHCLERPSIVPGRMLTVKQCNHKTVLELVSVPCTC